MPAVLPAAVMAVSLPGPAASPAPPRATARPARAQATPHFAHEQAFWREGLSFVARVDVVGRGALAGPLVAAAVVFPACDGTILRRLRRTLATVRDSKLLTPDQRRALVEPITSAASGVAV